MYGIHGHTATLPVEEAGVRERECAITLDQGMEVDFALVEVNKLWIAIQILVQFTGDLVSGVPGVYVLESVMVDRGQEKEIVEALLQHSEDPTVPVSGKKFRPVMITIVQVFKNYTVVYLLDN